MDRGSLQPAVNGGPSTAARRSPVRTGLKSHSSMFAAMPPRGRRSAYRRKSPGNRRSVVAHQQATKAFRVVWQWDGVCGAVAEDALKAAFECPPSPLARFRELSGRRSGLAQSTYGRWMAVRAWVWPQVGLIQCPSWDQCGGSETSFFIP